MAKKNNIVSLDPEFRNLPKPEIKTPLDNDAIQYCNVDLIKHVNDDHIVKRMAIELSKVTAIRPSTIMLAGVGVYSDLLSRMMTVKRNGQTIPLNGYYVLEQPTSTSKTRILSTFQQPFSAAYREKRKQLLKEQADSDKEKESEAAMLVNAFNGFMKTNGITNATPEGIEKHLSASRGYFSCFSSEQGLFDSLVGALYKKNEDDKQNNDLALSAFDGAYMNVLRSGRNDTFEGYPVGTIVLFAQEGSVDTLLKSSGVSGLGERFTKLAERHRFGEEIELRAINAEIYDDYVAACNAIIEPFMMSNSFHNQQPFFMLPSLAIKNSDHYKITEFYTEFYSEFDDGKRYSNAGMRGFCGKVNVHVCKLAAVFHVMANGIYENEIESQYIDSAIAIYRELIRAHELLLDKKGITGDKAAYQAIIKILGNTKKTRTEIKQYARKILPFSAFSGDKNQYMNSIIDQMIDFDLLAIEIEMPSHRELYCLKR